MSDIEERLRTVMHSAVDGEEASPNELIRLVMRRHRVRTVRLAGTAGLAALAIAVSSVIALHSPISRPGRSLSGHVAKLPTRMSGLPMPAGTNFEFLISTTDGAAWYSTATLRAEPISGLPKVFSGYQFERVWGGWVARSVTYNSPCDITQCAGPPATFYFIANGSMTATRIGKAYAQDGINPASRAEAVWLTSYPRSSTQITGSSSSQLVNTVGQPLGPRYRMPANYLMGRGVGKYLLLDFNYVQTQFELWDPATGRVLGHFPNVVTQGSEGIVWTKGCQRCHLKITNVSTGKTITTPIPAQIYGNQPSSLPTALTDDGRLLAVQAPGQELDIINTSTGSITRVAGTALSAAEWESFDWQNEGHRLIIMAGPNSGPGPDQVGYWQPGDAHIHVFAVRSPHELQEIETGQF